MSYFFIAIIVGILFYRDAHAYIDPGTGSYLFQLILGAAVGVLIGSKSIYRKATGFASLLKKKFLHLRRGNHGEERQINS